MKSERISLANYDILGMQEYLEGKRLFKKYWEGYMDVTFPHIYKQHRYTLTANMYLLNTLICTYKNLEEYQIKLPLNWLKRFDGTPLLRSINASGKF